MFPEYGTKNLTITFDDLSYDDNRGPINIRLPDLDAIAKLILTMDYDTPGEKVRGGDALSGKSQLEMMASLQEAFERIFQAILGKYRGRHPSMKMTIDDLKPLADTAIQKIVEKGYPKRVVEWALSQPGPKFATYKDIFLDAQLSILDQQVARPQAGNRSARR